jgi:hypothetical protein
MRARQVVAHLVHGRALLDGVRIVGTADETIALRAAVIDLN